MSRREYHADYYRRTADRRKQASIAKQLAQPALLTDRVQPIRRPVLRLRKL